MLKPEKFLEEATMNGKNDETSIDILEKKTISAVQRYLASCIFEGIGPTIAKRVVNEFGITTVQIIQKAPRELSRVKGVGVKRILSIEEGWAFQRKIQASTALIIKHRSDAVESDSEIY
ncbi:MAG: helix-hairpin-helix domain-containing protein [Thermodesulfovibrionales bacterium]